MVNFIIGSFIGSFLCVVAQRVPVNRSFVYARSECDHCHKQLRFWEMIPVLSCLFLRFRCHRCHKKISITIWLAEIIYGGLMVLIFLQTTEKGQLLSFIWLTSAFLLSLTDWFYGIVEPKILYPSQFLMWGAMFYYQEPFYVWSCALLLGLILWFSFYRKEVLGLGDLILLAFWIPWLSLQQLGLLLLIASSLALCVFGIYYLWNKKPLERLPFVPFLSIGLVVLFF